MIFAICWIIGIGAVVYLSSNDKEGWGWIIFILLVTGVPSGNKDVKDIDKRLTAIEAKIEKAEEEPEKEPEKAPDKVEVKKPKIEKERW